MKKLSMFAAILSVAALFFAPRAASGQQNFVRDCSTTITVSSTYEGGRDYSPSGANDGDRKGLNWERGGGWSDATRDLYPDWMQATFAIPRTVSRVVVVGLQNNFNAPVEPTPEMTSVYSLTDYDVQAFDGRNWQTVHSVRGNDKVLNDITLTVPVTTRALRIWITNARAYFSRIVELEAY